MIQYEHGDICNKETGARYKSQISFTCDMGNGDPSYQMRKPTHLWVNEETCLYGFEWKMKFACTQCRKNQVDALPGQCVESEREEGSLLENGAGFRKTHYKPLEGANCIIHPDYETKADGELVDR